MTLGQQAFADGFAASLATHGQTWVRASDSAQIQAIPASLKDTNPHLIDGPNSDFTIIVASTLLQPVLTAAQVMPTTKLKPGDELTKGTKHYRVSRVDLRESNTTYRVVLTATA